MTNKHKIKCLFGFHDFSEMWPQYKDTFICSQCRKKTLTKARYRRSRTVTELIGDVVDNTIVHYVDEYTEKWLSNGGWIYDKKRDCKRKKRQVWRSKKPKNWIYEKYFK